MSSRYRVFSFLAVSCLVSALAQAQSIQVGGDGGVSIHAGGVAIDVGGAGTAVQAPAPRAASGQDIVIDGTSKSLSATCRGGQVAIQGTNNTVRLSGNCTRIIVDGTSNSVTATSAVCNGSPVSVAGTNNKLHLLGYCTSLNVEGTSNDVAGMQVGAITISGTSNAIGWRENPSQQPPRVSTEGVGNRVYQVR